MGEIILLQEDTIHKIAAGEVIERPASIIKELIENSLDAKANRITVKVGKDFVSVKDNGKGMSYEDLKICFYPHSTSKLKDSSNLFDINTLGFRGEALSSISAVSLLEITSKSSDTAYKIFVQESNITSISPSAYEYDSGTEITVKKLFYNTPARKKYLKNENTELRKIKEIIEKYLVAYNNVFFRLINEDKTIINAPPEKDLKKRFYQVYKNEAKEMINLDKIKDEKSLQTKNFLLEKKIRIKGLISKPSLSKKTRYDQMVFVNNRLVKSKLIYSAISQAYKGYLNSGEYPVIMLKINLDPEKVDVNIHPQKQEIKFMDEKLVFKSVHSIIRNALESSDLTFKHSFENNNENQEKIHFLGEKNKTINKKKDIGSEVLSQTLLKDNDVTSKDKYNLYSEDRQKSPLRIIGFFNKEFIIAENEKNKSLVLVDFHAAAEIVNYYKLKQQFEESSVEYQSLVEPKVIELNGPDMDVLKANMNLVKRLGFFIENFGNDSMITRTLPVVIKNTIKAEKIKEIASKIKEGEKFNFNHMKDNILKMMACRASEKAG
ncbi:MAG: DNA mismatch repair endonuclease MutL, partial [Nanobdellota archaeon]